jgi:hypothetical protein
MQHPLECEQEPQILHLGDAAAAAEAAGDSLSSQTIILKHRMNTFNNVYSTMGHINQPKTKHPLL